MRGAQASSSSSSTFYHPLVWLVKLLSKQEGTQQPDGQSVARQRCDTGAHLRVPAYTHTHT